MTEVRKPERKTIYLEPESIEKDVAYKNMHKKIGYNECLDQYDAWIKQQMNVERIQKWLLNHFTLGTCAFVEGCHENLELAQEIIKLLEE